MTEIRKSLFFVALTICLIAAIGVSIFAVLPDRESGQLAAAMVHPPVAEWESSSGLTAVSESTAEGPWESASVTSTSDPESGGAGYGVKNGIKADHDGVCPFKDSQL